MRGLRRKDRRPPRPLIGYRVAPTSPRSDLDRCRDVDGVKRLTPRRVLINSSMRANQAAPLPTPDEWQVAVAISRQLADQSWAAYNRFVRVLRLLAVLFESGLVIAALRANKYGRPVAMESSHWLNECNDA